MPLADTHSLPSFLGCCLPVHPRFCDRIPLRNVCTCFQCVALLRVLTTLFPRDIRSLSAGLNYPPSAPVPSPGNNPANEFANAILAAQSAMAMRIRFNKAWKLIEFWEDRVVKPMAVIGRVLDPIIKNALEKKGERKESATDDSLEGETLLNHLVNLTDGKPCFCFFSSL